MNNHSFRLILGISLMGASSSALAEHAKINLDVIAPNGQQTAFVDQTPPASGKNPRPVLWG